MLRFYIVMLQKNVEVDYSLDLSPAQEEACVWRLCRAKR